MTVISETTLARIKRINARCVRQGEANRIHAHEVQSARGVIGTYSIYHVSMGEYQIQSTHDVDHAIYLLRYYNQLELDCPQSSATDLLAFTPVISVS